MNNKEKLKKVLYDLDTTHGLYALDYNEDLREEDLIHLDFMKSIGYLNEIINEMEQ